MGWVALALLAAGAFAALLALRVPRPLWSMVGAALMLGAAGYALQGSPALPASDAVARDDTLVEDDATIELRSQMFGRFGFDSAYLTASDALARSGSSRYAVDAILGGLRRDGQSVLLWTALGSMLTRHDRALSPAARLAFDRAIGLDPRNPGPRFFLGIAQVRAGDLAGAQRSWQRALTLTAPQAPYRQQIEQRLAMLVRLRTITGR